MKNNISLKDLIYYEYLLTLLEIEAGIYNVK